MPDFLWKAAQADAQIVEGRLQAASLSQAMQQLRAQRLTPLQVVETDTNSGAAGVTPLVAPQTPNPAHGKVRASKPINQTDILAMTSELSIMLKAGLPLDNALRVLIGMNAKPAMAAMTQSILDDVKSGVPLSRALTRHPQQFGDFYINMVRSGEVGGQLSSVLERLNEHLERLRAFVKAWSLPASTRPSCSVSPCSPSSRCSGLSCLSSSRCSKTWATHSPRRLASS